MGHVLERARAGGAAVRSTYGSATSTLVSAAGGAKRSAAGTLGGGAAAPGATARQSPATQRARWSTIRRRRSRREPTSGERSTCSSAAGGANGSSPTKKSTAARADDGRAGGDDGRGGGDEGCADGAGASERGSLAQNSAAGAVIRRTIERGQREHARLERAEIGRATRARRRTPRTGRSCRPGSSGAALPTRRIPARPLAGDAVHDHAVGAEAPQVGREALGGGAVDLVLDPNRPWRAASRGPPPQSRSGPRSRAPRATRSPDPGCPRCRPGRPRPQSTDSAGVSRCRWRRRCDPVNHRSRRRRSPRHGRRPAPADGAAGACGGAATPPVCGSGSGSQAAGECRGCRVGPFIGGDHSRRAPGGID